MSEPAFRVAFAPGVTLDKWARIWADRRPGRRLDAHVLDVADLVPALRAKRAEMAFVRLPVDREGLHLIPLYHEIPVVVAAADHPIAAYDEVPLADLADEHLVQDPDTVPEWRDIATEVADGSRAELPELSTAQAVETVAAGTGIVILALSVARLHHRKDVVHRPVLGVAESQIGLAWLTEADDPDIEAFVGIVRGRTPRSSRGDDGGELPGAPSSKKAPPAATAGKRPAPPQRRRRPPRDRRRG